MPLGACATGDPHSALAGRSALVEGGNAVDAIVAAGIMACVSMPTMTGLGGGGLMTLLVDGKVEVLDFWCDVPGRGLDPGTRPPPVDAGVPFEDMIEIFHIGAPTIAVPGTVAGLWAVHERYGRLPMRDLVGLAVEAARNGIEITDAAYRACVLLQAIFRHTPEAWALIGTEDGIHASGSRVRHEALADTLELLAAEGPRAFYEGDVAKAIVEIADGLVTPDDLAAYRPAWRKALRGRYRRATVHMPGAPSLSGGMLQAALADLAQGPPLPHRPRAEDWFRVLNAMRRAEMLRTPEYEASLFEEGFLEAVVAKSASGCTMHLSAVDADGNAVAYTTSTGEGSGLVAPGYGFVLNNCLGEPDLLPRGGAFVPGARMMTGMCPTLVEEGDGALTALGSAGSERIRSAILQVLLHVVDGRHSLNEAVARPRLHVTQDKLFVEGYGRTPEEVEALRPYGLELVTTWAPGFFFGGAQAVRRSDAGFEAAADRIRRGGAAYVV